MELNFTLVGSKTTFLSLLTNTANLSVECLFLHLGDGVLTQGEKDDGTQNGSSTTAQKWCTSLVIFYWPKQEPRLISMGQGNVITPEGEAENIGNNYKIHCTDLYIMPFVNKAGNLT